MKEKKIKRDTKITMRNNSTLYASIGTVLKEIPPPEMSKLGLASLRSYSV